MFAKRRNATLFALCLASAWAAAAHAQTPGSAPRTLKEAAALDAEIDIAKRKQELESIRSKGEPKLAAPATMMTPPAPTAGAAAMPQSNPYAAPMMQMAPVAPAKPATPVDQGVRLRATYGVGADTTAIIVRSNGDFARMHRGEVFDGWRVDAIEPGSVVVSRYRAIASRSTARGKSTHRHVASAHAGVNTSTVVRSTTSVATRSQSGSGRYRIDIDQPQQAGGMGGMQGQGMGAIVNGGSGGGPNRLYAEPLGSLPNPNRNVNQIVPMSTSTNMVPRPAGAGAGLVGGGVTNTDARANAQLSNVTNQVAPGLQPVPQPPAFDPSTSMR